MAYRVDTVPWALRPIYWVFALGMAAWLYALLLCIRITCTFRAAERPALDARGASASAAEPTATSEAASHSASAPAPDTADGPRIECIWHESLPVYMAAHLFEGSRYVWINHPLWFMKPVHLVLRWSGVRRLALGSSGHGGRAALDEVRAEVERGAWTLFAVDGPAGPRFQPKRGAVDLSAATGLPIVAIRYRYSLALTLPGWDRKRLPLPFTRIDVSESPPLFVRPGEEAAALTRLADLLHG